MPNSITTNYKTCTHIKITGHRCGSPALHGQKYCYFHQQAHSGFRRATQSRLHPVAMLESEEAIQCSIMEIINALLRDSIDLKRATLILRALHIAVKNARRVRLDMCSDQMVTEIPDDAVPATAASTHSSADAVLAPLSEMDLPLTAAVTPGHDATASELRRAERAFAKARLQDEFRAKATPAIPTHGAADASVRHAQQAAAQPASNSTAVATAANGCPSGPGVSAHSTPTGVRQREDSSAPNPAHRKPPAAENKALQERKTAAHSAGRG